MKLTWRLSFSTFRMDRKQVQCLDCGKKLSSRDRLRSMFELRSQKSWDASYCPFEGTHGEQMRAHRRSQHGADRLQCTQWDTTFTHSSSLTQHMASVHSNTHIACMQCGQLCASAKALAEHQRGMHGGETYDCKFNCTEVSFANKWLASLILDARQHNFFNTTTLLCKMASTICIVV